METNLGMNWSLSLSKLVGIARETAAQSTLSIRHGAVLFSSKNQILQTSCNGLGHKTCGFNVPSLHAEAGCLRSLYARACKVDHRYQGRGGKGECLL
jgi:hypothetical protein